MSRRHGELAARLGVRSTLYGLRHFMATSSARWPRQAPSAVAWGHGSLAVTSIYTHRVAEADRAAARHMGELLDG
jgi:hypothetical protein